MSSFLLPKTIIDNYNSGFFDCPYCRQKITVASKTLADPTPCPHCKKTVLIPHRLGPFWLFQQLGAGAMGCVYKAFHEVHQRSIYAVKTVSRHEKSNERLIRALQREAQVTSRFSEHPNIINFVAHGWEGDEYYLALEYIQGETLLETIKRVGKLSEVEALRITSDVISAERFICDQGYLFRDLKPENILIANENNHVFLFDFGLTLPIEIAQLDQGTFLEASPIYVPPERLTGEGEDVSSEVYSLGMVLYYALTGQTFFTTAQEVTGILKRHVSSFRLSGEVTKMGKLSEDLAEVLSKMKKRMPEERYQDFASLQLDVDRLIQTRAGGATPATASQANSATPLPTEVSEATSEPVPTPAPAIAATPVAKPALKIIGATAKPAPQSPAPPTIETPPAAAKPTLKIKGASAEPAPAPANPPKFALKIKGTAG